MLTLYVWSGSLRGVQVDGVESSAEAIDRAVRANLPCILGPAIRVTRSPKGLDPQDVYYEAPYEDLFPDLFDGSLDVQVMTTDQLEKA